MTGKENSNFALCLELYISVSSTEPPLKKYFRSSNISSKVLDSPSQGYYSNELKTETKPIETKPGSETTLEPPICLGCIEPEYSTQKSTFMCFSWRKKPKTITNHTCYSKK